MDVKFTLSLTCVESLCSLSAKQSTNVSQFSADSKLISTQSQGNIFEHESNTTVLVNTCMYRPGTIA